MELGKPWILLAACMLFAVEAAAAGTIYSTTFGRDKWNQDDWILVKSSRWGYIGSWVQHDEYIQNRMPNLAEPGKLVPGEQSYMSMVLRDMVEIGRGIAISSTMEFEFDQAPQIILAAELGSDASGYPEYRDHFEIVLYARGINIWRHGYADGKPSWILAAHSNFPLEAEERHLMRVEILQPRGNAAVAGKTISVSVGDHHFAYHEESLPDKLHVGIIGYASKNRFYDFEVKKQ